LNVLLLTGGNCCIPGGGGGGGAMPGGGIMPFFVYNKSVKQDTDIEIRTKKNRCGTQRNDEQ
jgi:hypothetical protein